MTIRDRVRELRRVRASDLRPNPRNWRTHPAAQSAMMRRLLGEVGYADAVLVRELDDGALEIIDGHLRADITPEMEIPVLVIDVNQLEADKILASHDPVSAMAQTDEQQLTALLASIEAEDAEFLAKIAEMTPLAALPSPPEVGGAPNEPEIAASFRVVVECESEEDQRQLYEQMREEGYSCRLLML